MNKLNTIAIYPGSFDPITNGHIDVIERASELFDYVIVVIAVNTKKTCLFTQQERMVMARESLKHLNNIGVDTYEGLVVDYARVKSANAIIRGIRAITDFEYEFQISLMNRKLAPEIKTVFLMPHEKYTYLNSSIIRELASFHQDVGDFVNQYVNQKLFEKFNY